MAAARNVDPDPNGEGRVGGGGGGGGLLKWDRVIGDDGWCVIGPTESDEVAEEGEGGGGVRWRRDFWIFLNLTKLSPDQNRIKIETLVLNLFIIIFISRNKLV